MSVPHTASGVKSTLPKQGLSRGGRVPLQPPTWPLCLTLDTTVPPPHRHHACVQAPTFAEISFPSSLPSHCSSSTKFYSCLKIPLRTIFSSHPSKPFKPSSGHTLAFTTCGGCLCHPPPDARYLCLSPTQGVLTHCKHGPLSPAYRTSHREAQYLPNRTELLVYRNC